MKLRQGRRVRRRRRARARRLQPGRELGSGKGTINFGIELPQQGSELAASQPIINGIKLAVKHAGGTAGGWTIDIPNSVVLDDAKDGVHDPQTGAHNMTTLVVEPERRGRHRPAQLERRQGPDPDLERGRPAPVLAGEHERGPHQAGVRRARHPQDQPDEDQLRPGRHDGRQPGSGGCPLHPAEPQHQDRLHRRLDTTPSGRASPTTSRSTSRRTAGPSWRVTAPRRARPTTRRC